jgi:hypothetical protein
MTAGTLVFNAQYLCTKQNISRKSMLNFTVIKTYRTKFVTAKTRTLAEKII